MVAMVRPLSVVEGAIGKAKGAQSAYAAQPLGPRTALGQSAPDARTLAIPTNSATRLTTLMEKSSLRRSRSRSQKPLAIGARPEKVKLTWPKFKKIPDLTKDSSTKGQSEIGDMPTQSPARLPHRPRKRRRVWTQLP